MKVTNNSNCNIRGAITLIGPATINSTDEKLKDAYLNEKKQLTLLMKCRFEELENE